MVLDCWMKLEGFKIMITVDKDTFEKIMSAHNAVQEGEFEVEPYTTINWFNKDHNRIGHSRQYGYGGDTVYNVLEELIK